MRKGTKGKKAYIRESEGKQGYDFKFYDLAGLLVALNMMLNKIWLESSHLWKLFSFLHNSGWHVTLFCITRGENQAQFNLTSLY